jgi:peptidoglycan hydrolase-like protein with peptidoglycan-binding domain
LTKLQQFPQTTTGAVRTLDTTGGPTLRRHLIPRRLIPLLIALLIVSSFFTMTVRANADSTPAPQYPGHTISYGTTGTSVKLIQTTLNRYGAHLAVDGIFGPLTRAAVISFQRTQQLEPDGIIGPATWQTLFNSVGAGSKGVYINPFQPDLWGPARTDQGVDWLPLQPNTPVLAIGAGVVTFSSLHSYWVGGGNITYQLTAGPKAGLYIYVAEHLTSVLPVGSVITPGEVIATAQPGFPWTEWGWAAPPGTGSYAPAVPYSGTPDGKPTRGGLAMAKFFNELGATTLQDPGDCPDTPY